MQKVCGLLLLLFADPGHCSIDTDRITTVLDAVRSGGGCWASVLGESFFKSKEEQLLFSLLDHKCTPLWEASDRILRATREAHDLDDKSALRHTLNATTYLVDLDPTYADEDGPLGDRLALYTTPKSFSLSKLPRHELIRGSTNEYHRQFILSEAQYSAADAATKAALLAPGEADDTQVMLLVAPHPVENLLPDDDGTTLARLDFGPGLAERVPRVCQACQAQFPKLSATTQYKCLVACRTKLGSELWHPIASLLSSDAPEGSQDFDPVQDLAWLIRHKPPPSTTDPPLPDALLSALDRSTLTGSQMATLLLHRTDIPDEALIQVVVNANPATESLALEACFALYYYRTAADLSAFARVRGPLEFLVSHGLLEEERESLLWSFPRHARKVLNYLIGMVIDPHSDAETIQQDVKSFAREMMPSSPTNRQSWYLELMHSNLLDTLTVRAALLPSLVAELGDGWPLSYSIEDVIGDFANHSPLAPLVDQESFSRTLAAASASSRLIQLYLALIADRISMSVEEGRSVAEEDGEDWSSWNERALRILSGESLEAVLTDAPHSTKAETQEHPARGLAKVSPSLPMGNQEEVLLDPEESSLANIWPSTLASEPARDWTLFTRVFALLARHRRGLGLANLLLHDRDIGVDWSAAAPDTRMAAWSLTISLVHDAHELQLLMANLADPTLHNAIKALPPTSPAWPRAANALNHVPGQRSSRQELSTILLNHLKTGTEDAEALAFLLLPNYGSSTKEYIDALSKFAAARVDRLTKNAPPGSSGQLWSTISLVLAQRIIEMGWLGEKELEKLNEMLGRLLPLTMVALGQTPTIAAVRFFNKNASAANEQHWQTTIESILQIPASIEVQNQLLVALFSGFSEESWKRFLATVKTMPLLPIISRVSPSAAFGEPAKNLCEALGGKLSGRPLALGDAEGLNIIRVIQVLSSPGDRGKCESVLFEYLGRLLLNVKEEEPDLFRGDSVASRLQARLGIDFETDPVAAAALAPLAQVRQEIYMAALSGAKIPAGKGLEDFEVQLKDFLKDFEAEFPHVDSAKWLAQRSKRVPQFHEAALTGQVSSLAYRAAFRILGLLGSWRFGLLTELLGQATSEAHPSQASFLNYVSLVLRRPDEVEAQLHEANEGGAKLSFVSPDLASRGLAPLDHLDISEAQHQPIHGLFLNERAFKSLSPDLRLALLRTPLTAGLIDPACLTRSVLLAAGPHTLALLGRGQASRLGAVGGGGEENEGENPCHVLAEELYAREVWATGWFHHLSPACLQRAETFWTLAFIDRTGKNYYRQASELARQLTRENFEGMHELRAGAVAVPPEFWQNLGQALEEEGEESETNSSRHPCRVLPEEMMASDSFWANANAACLSAWHEASERQLFELATPEQRALIPSENLPSDRLNLLHE